MTDEEITTTWEQLKRDWSRRKATPITVEQFEAIFCDGNYADEAVELASTNSTAFKSLFNAGTRIAEIDDSDVERVWLAVLSTTEVESLWPTMRRNQGQAERLSALSSLVENLVQRRGRQEAREITQRHWWKLRLSEEEREGVVRGLLSGGVRDVGFYRRLGFDPTRIAQERGYLLEPTQMFSTTILASRSPADEQVCSRLDVLLADVCLPVDLRDSGLLPHELQRVTASAGRFAPDWSGFARAMRKFGHPGMWEEMWHAMRHTPLPVAASSLNGQGNQWHFPVFRLLHLQQILEAPSLTRFVRDPALSLVPDVALYMLGRDDVAFQPELRIMRGAENRWRARWVESAGEAAAAMFLEDAVQMDLATLARIQERPDELTPDFMATTIQGRPLVFEAKGGTRWNTHLAQRRYALKQLGKDDGTNGSAWPSAGRTFACSLFAAQQGDDRSSLFHVDDPPFAFDRLFGEGGDYRCRLRHAVAMLETARLFDAARELERGRGFERERVETSMFDLRSEGESNSQDSERFVGNFLPLMDWAQALGHPDHKLCSRLRMFVGVEQRLFTRLAEGQVGAVESSEESSTFNASTVGVLPGRQGVYSRLADGSFMAIEVK